MDDTDDDYDDIDEPIVSPEEELGRVGGDQFDDAPVRWHKAA